MPETSGTKQNITVDLVALSLCIDGIWNMCYVARDLASTSSIDFATILYITAEQLCCIEDSAGLYILFPYF